MHAKLITQNKGYDIKLEVLLTCDMAYDLNCHNR